MDEKTEKLKYMSASLKFLYEMELVELKEVQNTLYGNIYSFSDQIKNVELIIDPFKKTMLIYLEWSKKQKFIDKYLKFLKKKTSQNIQDEIGYSLAEVLPNYKFRIVNDLSILNLSKELILKSKIQSIQLNKKNLTS